MAKTKEKITIKINWSAVVRVAVGTIILSALYHAYKTDDSDAANNSDQE